MEIYYGLFIVLVPYFIGKSLGIFKILIFGLWSFIRHPNLEGLESSSEGQNGVELSFQSTGEHYRMFFPQFFHSFGVKNSRPFTCSVIDSVSSLP